MEEGLFCVSARVRKSMETGFDALRFAAGDQSSPFQR